MKSLFELKKELVFLESLKTHLTNTTNFKTTDDHNLFITQIKELGNRISAISDLIKYEERYSKLKSRIIFYSVPILFSLSLFLIYFQLVGLAYTLTLMFLLILYIFSHFTLEKPVLSSTITFIFTAILVFTLIRLFPVSKSILSSSMEALAVVSILYPFIVEITKKK